MDGETMPDGIELDSLKRQLIEHQLNYERRHAELESRVMRLETIMTSLATREDLANFRLTVAALQETVKQFESLSESVATKKDVEWIKSFIEKMTAGVAAILLTVIGALVSHIFVGKP